MISTKLLFSYFNNLILLSLICFCVEPSTANPSVSGHRLIISPSGEVTNQPAKQAFVLTCKGNGERPTLFTNLRWFDPRGEEITTVYTRDRNPDITSQEYVPGYLFLQFEKPRPDDSGVYKCKGFIQSSEPLEAQIHVQFFGKFYFILFNYIIVFIQFNSFHLIKSISYIIHCKPIIFRLFISFI